MSRALGLIVNPIAGMGGAVGLKGTDGQAAVQAARRLGAVPLAPQRATAALEELGRAELDIEILTCGGAMGEESAAAARLPRTIVYEAPATDTTAADTRAAARELARRGADLILFAGGDGTARDVFEAVGQEVPVLGIPAGVKIHSACYAVSPRAAGALAARFLATGAAGETRDAEVMDVDEVAFRRGELSARLAGYVRVPSDSQLLQGAKVRTVGDRAANEELRAAVIAQLEPGTRYVVGPGTTTRDILAAMDLPATLLGVDVIEDVQVVGLDVGERELLNLVRDHPAVRIIVTPIGGQGYLFGRGNQQISARVLRAVGIRNVMVVATPAKLASLGGRPFLVDTDDEELNRDMAGFVTVVTGLRQEAVYPVGFSSAGNRG
jgi:predicted polyphosphate/ATP-dependent NAD kinase